MNYFLASFTNSNLHYDGSSLSFSIDLRQFSANQGFSTPPQAIISVSAQDQFGNTIAGSTGVLAGYELTISLPSAPSTWKAVSAGLGY